MNKALIINRLYAWVLHNDMTSYGVSEKEVVKGIEHMKKAYSSYKTSNLASSSSKAADFKSVEYRCAYIHKFAPLHTILFSEIAEHVMNLHYNYFYDIIATSGCVNVCSLGGGPGSDIVGIILSLHNVFGPTRLFTNVIDCMPLWNKTLNSLIEETQNGAYGKLRTCFSAQYFDWKYVGADLLDDFSEEVLRAISSADIINMVKFVSAAVCVDTPPMIKRIFSIMKPGAIVFFVDNSVGQVKHILTKTAEECELEPLYGPINHERYVNRSVVTTRFGYSSCYATNIAIQVWVKPHRPVQDWLGTPIEAWTPFEKDKKRKINLVDSSQGPFCGISKSLQFEDFDDNLDTENSFYSDEIGIAPFTREVVFPDENISILNSDFPQNFRNRNLISTPNFSDSPSSFNASPLIYNNDDSYNSPIKSYKRSNFEVQCAFDNSFHARTIADCHGHTSPDSGCWSGEASFINSLDRFDDSDYRRPSYPIDNFCNSPVPFRHVFSPGESAEFESPLNVQLRSVIQVPPKKRRRGRKSQNWNKLNSRKNVLSKASTYRFAGRNKRKFNPYRRL